MKTLTKLLTGAAGVAALAGGAAPASAQYYGSPYGYGYSPYASPYGYPYGYDDPGNIVGQIVNSVVGSTGSAWSGDTRANLDRCAAVVAQRINAGYSPFGYGYGYGMGYGAGRVVGIHSIERIGNGLRIRGVASDGRMPPYAPYAAAAAPDLRFRCDVSYNGYVMDVSLGANTDYTYNWTPYAPGYY